MSKRSVVAIGALFLALSAPFGAKDAMAKPRMGFWLSQPQTCTKVNEQGVCKKWSNSGQPDKTNTFAPKAEGSLCGNAESCKVETETNTARMDNLWMEVCPLTGKILGR